MADETENAPGAESAAREERMFTQAEVDELIGRRLAEESEKYPGPEELAAFHAWQQTGRVRFTAPLADGADGTLTREQIMAIPDRAARRRAIAENLDLF